MFTGAKQTKTSEKQEEDGEKEAEETIEKKPGKAKEKGKGEKKVKVEGEFPTLAINTVMNMTSPGFDRSTFPSQV
jgi:hypothetical protein